MMAGDAHRHKEKNENYEGDGDKLYDCSNGSHRSNGLTVPGEVFTGLTIELRSGRLDGRARSPVLNASAVAVVKIVACVSWLTLRAAARFRCALTISG